MLRVLVTGGRDFADRDLLFDGLDELHQERGISLIIHGAAKGADSLAEEWGKARGVETLPCPADWKRHGRGAGSARNKQMLIDHKPDVVVAFPGGKGTANMVEIAEKAGVEVLVASAGE